MADDHAPTRTGFPGPAGLRQDRAHRCGGLSAGLRGRRKANPDAYWAKEAKRIAWIKEPTKIKNTSFHRRRLDQVVRGRRAERLGVLPRPASGEARRPDRDHLGRRRPEHLAACDVPAVARAGLPPGQRDEVAGRQEGRRGDDLPADGAGSCGGDAGLRAHRCDPLGGVRRVLDRQPGEPDPGLRLQAADHRR